VFFVLLSILIFSIEKKIIFVAVKKREKDLSICGDLRGAAAAAIG
jgi:hypothetical protein